MEDLYVKAAEAVKNYIKSTHFSLFAEDVDSTKYSEVCKAFETKGIFAFCTEISSAVNATIPDEREKQ